jgi:hypothetical protein
MKLLVGTRSNALEELKHKFGINNRQRLIRDRQLAIKKLKEDWLNKNSSLTSPPATSPDPLAADTQAAQKVVGGGEAGGGGGGGEPPVPPADTLSDSVGGGQTSPPKTPRTPKTKVAKVKVPKDMPRNISVSSHDHLKAMLKSKYVPSPPKEGQVSLVIQRPQIGPYSFHEYEKGDVIHDGSQFYVVMTSKPGFTRGGEGFKKWEQCVNARPATEGEISALKMHERAATIRRFLSGGIDQIEPPNAAELRQELSEIEAKLGT